MLHRRLLAALLLACAWPALGQPQSPPPPKEVRGHIDLQSHPAMHIPWGIMGFRKGLLDLSPARLTWRHQFTQVVYVPFLKRSGVRLFGAAAMAAERATSTEQARKLVIKQLAYVDDFVARHRDAFAIASTPQQARRLLAGTDRIVLMHQIEGGRKLFPTTSDAAAWRARGVTLVTVIHLFDDELGHAGLNEGFTGFLGNPLGAISRRLHPDRRRGLTRRGREVIVELARAGIIVDLSHMTRECVDDALDVCEQHGIPPVVTHGTLRSLRDGDRAITEAQLVRIYRLGGMFSMPLDGGGGTRDAFQQHVQGVHRVLRAHAVEIAGKPWDRLCDAERTRFAIGWAADWNGWTNHSRPQPGRPPELEVDRVGLAHPGLLPQYWQRLRESGLDFDPLERAPERFLQIWERVVAGARP